MNASRLGTYFHLPRMPVPTSPFGVASVGDRCLTIVHPVGAIGVGGVSAQTRPSPHQRTNRLRCGSKSIAQFCMSIALLARGDANSPVGSTAVIRTSLLARPGATRLQYMNGIAFVPVLTSSLRSGSSAHVVIPPVPLQKMPTV